MHTKDIKAQAQQERLRSEEDEAIIREQAGEQSDNFGSGLFCAATFAHATELPPMTDAYRAMNERMKAASSKQKAPEKDAGADVSPSAFTSDLPGDGEQPTFH